MSETLRWPIFGNRTSQDTRFLQQIRDSMCLFGRFYVIEGIFSPLQGDFWHP